MESQAGPGEGGFDAVDGAGDNGAYSRGRPTSSAGADAQSSGGFGSAHLDSPPRSPNAGWRSRRTQSMGSGSGLTTGGGGFGPADAGGSSAGNAGGGALVSQRARPPRRFGPLGEMDPFDWEAATSSAIIRAVLRDDSDVPSER